MQEGRAGLPDSAVKSEIYAQVTDRKISSDVDRLMERRKPAAGKEAAG